MPRLSIVVIACSITFLLTNVHERTVYGQTRIPLPLERPVEGVLTPESPAAVYEINVESGGLLEAVFTPDVEQRDFDFHFKLQTILGDELFVNDGGNFPGFLGGYMFVQLPMRSQFRLVVEASNLSRAINFTVLARTPEPDPPNRALQLNDPKLGTIGPAQNVDTFLISLNANVPVLLLVTTPDNILDPIVGVFDLQNNLLGVNNNFFGHLSALLFTPPNNGTFVVVVQGADFERAVGPYQLEAKTIPLFTPELSTVGEVLFPGDVEVFEMQSAPSRVVDFAVTGVDGFVPLIALTNSRQSVLAQSHGTPEAPIAIIPGFTSLEGENNFLFVMEDDINKTGRYGVDVTFQEDEEDGVLLQDGSLIAGTIGPIGDEDEYRIQLPGDAVYSLLVTPRWHNLDPQIQVFNDGGEVVLHNDDSVDGVFSLLSGFNLPEGEYRVRVMASSRAADDVRKTGVYALQFAQGTTFDRGTPKVAEHLITVERAAGRAKIHIPTNALFDDTFPLSAEIRADQAAMVANATLFQEGPGEIELEASPHEIFFLTLTDSAQSRNRSTTVVIPPPQVVSVPGGQLAGIAIDRENHLFITDAESGVIARVNIDGSTRPLVTGLPTSGGTLGPNALAFDAQGNLYVSNARSNQISKVLPDGQMEVFLEGEVLGFPIAIAFDSDSFLYVAQLGGDNVIKVSPDKQIEVLTAAIRNPQTLAFSPDGLLHIGSDSGKIFQIMPSGELLEFAELNGGNVEAIAFDQDGFLYAADGQAGFLHRFSPGGERVTFSRGLSGPVDLAYGRGEFNRILFAVNLGATGNFFAGTLIGIPTGRPGLPLPFGTTRISNWHLW